MFCKYKDSLGVPKKGIHGYRFLGLAIVDVVMTVVFAGLLSWWFQWNFAITLLLMFLLGIALHRLFCVRTTIDQYLFR
jgi:hypothetical protein